MNNLTVDFAHGDKSSLLGVVVELASVGAWSTYPIFMLRRWVIPAIHLGHLCVFRDQSGREVGFASWAFLDDAISDRMERDDVAVLHLSEWTEGLDLWIIHVEVVPGYSMAVMRHMRRRMFPHHNMARFITRGPDGEFLSVRKVRRPATGDRGRLGRHLRHETVERDDET